MNVVTADDSTNTELVSVQRKGECVKQCIH